MSRATPVLTQAPEPAVAKPVLGDEPWIHPTARVRDSDLGAYTMVGAGTTIQECTVGDYTYFTDSCSAIWSSVGKFGSIASHTRLNPGNHPTWRVTQHHLTYRRVMYGFGSTDDEEFFAWRRAHGVTVGHDVWLGHAVVILPGVTIGTGAVVAAGGVVSKDVAPYTIVGGVPARPIKARFPKAIAERLLRIAWWDWSRDELESRFGDFNDLDTFLEKFDS